MKKVLALVLAAALCLSFAACGGSASSSAPASEAASASAAVSEAAPGGKVGVCIYKFDDAFMTLYRNELEKNLKDMGYEVTIVDGKNDQATQSEQVDTFISQGVDVLVMNLVQSTAASTIIDKAKAADIPVVFINREPTAEELASYEKCCYVGADARQSGKFQGEIIATLENKGDYNGDGTVSYVMIQGDPENVDAKFRTEFSIKALTDAGIKTEELFKQRGDWDRAKGQELAANALTQFGEKIDVIFCNNDDMAIGAAQAITAAGRTVGKDIALVGVDALEEAQTMVEAGTMTGTVLNDAVGQAGQAAACVKVFVEGGANMDDGDQNFTVDYVKIEKK